MLGTWVNAVAIIGGSLIGLLFKSRFPSSMQDALFHALALVVIVIGISGMLEVEHVLLMIISLSLGTFFGEIIKLELKIQHLLEHIESKLSQNKEKGWFARGFLSATILFGIGAMAIVGSFEAGLNQNYEILYTKSTLDFVASILLSASLGIGVMFSSISIIIYQGTLTLFASTIAVYLAPQSIALMSATGSALILALGLNMLKVTNIKVTNMLFSLVFALVFGFFI